MGIIIVSRAHRSLEGLKSMFAAFMVHRMVSLYLEKQKHDEQQDELQKQFFHQSDMDNLWVSRWGKNNSTLTVAENGTSSKVLVGISSVRGSPKKWN